MNAGAATGKESRIVGALLLLVALMALLFTFAFAKDASLGSPYTGGAAEWALTTCWLVSAGVLLVRGSPPSSFIVPAVLGWLGGAAGIVTWLPLSFGTSAAIDRRFDPLGFVAFSAAAAVAGTGHWLQTKGSPRAKLAHAVAAALVVAGVLYVVARHA